MSDQWRKALDETKTNTTTAANDADLRTSLMPGFHYFHFTVFINMSSTAPNLKVGVSYTGTMTDMKANISCFFGTSVSSGRISAVDELAVFDLPAGDSFANIDGYLNAATAGILSLKWAPNSSTAATLTFQKGSGGLFLRVR